MRLRRGAEPTLRRLAQLALSPTHVRRDQALEVLERLSAVTHAMGSAEQLANHHERLPGGVNDWDAAKAALAYRNPFLRSLTHVVARPEVTNAVHLARLGAGLVLVTPYGSNGARAAANAVCVAGHALTAPRHYYGADGSDHVALMSQTLTLVSRMSKKDPAVTDAALWLSSMQAVMSYAVSGWVKLAGDKWRNDEAFEGVMRTRVYGNEMVWRLLQKHPLAGKVVGKLTLAVECGYPIIYVGGGRLARPLMFSTAFMHVNIAWTMGLGRFVFAFLSMYGALAYTVQPREAGGDRRDDRMAHTAAVMGLGTIAALTAQARVRRHQVLQGSAGQQRLTTPTGSTLAWREQPGRDDSTLFVLESGLMAPAAFWGWTIDALAEHGSVLTYDRPGYGASTPGDGPRDVATMVADLEALVEDRAQGRSVVLIGHSVGGFLVHRLVAQRPDLVTAAVLVDASHPDELKRSDQQRAGNESLVPSLTLSRWSLEGGLGALLERPAWLHQIRPDLRVEAERIYRDARVWGAALQEWKAATEEFERTDGAAHVDRPLLVLTAHHTVASDEVMRDLHEEYAQRSVDGRHVVLPDANHESILTSRKVAQQTVTAISTFVQDLDAARQEEAV